MEFPVPPRPNRRGAAVPRRHPAPTVEYVDLTIRPDTPDPRPPKRVRPTPIVAPYPDPALIAPPPPSPAGIFWAWDAATATMVPDPIVVNAKVHKTAARRLMFINDPVVADISSRFSSIL